MTQRKDRDRVIAEITLSHLLRLANEHGCSVSREQAFIFLNQDGRAFEMWKQMMQAGEDFIVRSLLGQCTNPECSSDGISIHAIKRWLTVISRLFWRKSLAALCRHPVGCCSVSNPSLFERMISLQRVAGEVPWNPGSSSKRHAKKRRFQFLPQKGIDGSA